MMEGSADGPRADVTCTPGAVDGAEAREKVVLVRDRARDQQIHPLQAGDRVATSWNCSAWKSGWSR